METKDKLQELMERFTPRRCETQIEFDSVYHDINMEQSRLNHPYDDKIRDLNFQKSLVESQIQALRCNIDKIRMERNRLEQGKKEINRAYFELKHEWLQLNPKGLKNEE